MRAPLSQRLGIPIMATASILAADGVPLRHFGKAAMNIVKDAYENLCRARDALDAGPSDGPARTALYRAYLQARIQQMGRAEKVPAVIDPIPPANRRFYVMATDCVSGIEFNLSMSDHKAMFGSGYGNGWEGARQLPKLRGKTPTSPSVRRLPPIMSTMAFRGNDAVSRSLLDIWQRFDPEALDVLPITLTRRSGKPVDEEYLLVDVIRRLPALDLEAMNSFLLRSPKPHPERSEIFPPPRAFALRDDLPTHGLHLFRDTIWTSHYFVSAELRQACLDAGFKRIPFAHPETPLQLAK